MELPIATKFKRWIIKKLFRVKPKQKPATEFKKELKSLSVNQIIDKIFMVSSMISKNNLIPQEMRKELRQHSKNHLIRTLINLTKQLEAV
jgi:hypothetical protein